MKLMMKRVQYVGLFAFAATTAAVLAQESGTLNCWAWGGQSGCDFRSTGNCAWVLTTNSDRKWVKPASSGSSTKSGYDATCIYQTYAPDSEGVCIAGGIFTDIHRSEETTGSPCTGGGGEN